MKEMLKMSSLAGLIVVLMFTGGSRSYAEENDFSVIARSIEDRYREALLAADIESWILLWDDDAVMMPEYDLMVEGKQSIHTRMTSALRVLQYEVFDTQITKAVVFDNTGIIYGYFSETVKWKKSGNRERVFGKYIDVVKKEADGTWKIIADCVNRRGD